MDGLVECAKANIRVKEKHSFRVIKQQFGFQWTRLREMLKSRCKMNMLVAAHSNLLMAHRR
jgi:hypothetical protein